MSESLNIERDESTTAVIFLCVLGAGLFCLLAMVVVPLTHLFWQLRLSASSVSFVKSWLAYAATDPFHPFREWFAIIREGAQSPLLVFFYVVLPLFPSLFCPFLLWQRGDYSFRYTERGSSSFAKLSTIRWKMGLLVKQGTVLCDFAGKRLRMKQALSILLISPPGTGKSVHTTSSILEDYRTRPTLIINDVKGELYHLTGSYCSTQGQVHHLNWTLPHGPCFNPMSPQNIPGAENLMTLPLEIIEEMDTYFLKGARSQGKLLRLMRDHPAHWREHIKGDNLLVENLGTLNPDKSAEKAYAFVTSKHFAGRAGRLSELQRLYAAIDQHVDRMAAVMVPDKGLKESHWAKRGRTALASLMMFEIFRAVSERREPTVVRTLELLAGNDDMLKEFILVNRETKGDEGSLREFFKFAAVYAKISGYPQRCVNDLQGLGSAGQEELPSIVSTASGSLGCFNTQTVINRTSYSDISLADLRNYRKDPRFPNGASTTIYLDTPLKETETYAAINGLFIECAAAHLISEPDSIAEQRRVHFMLDEFHTLPKMDSLFNIPALGRGKGFKSRSSDSRTRK